MRSEGGYEVIKKAIQKLGLRHREHIAAYGDGNERRLTGRHETADINTFIWVSDRNLIPTAHFFHQPGHTRNGISSLFSCQGVANRGASVRVGRDTEKEGKGEMQCRRRNFLRLGSGRFRWGFCA